MASPVALVHRGNGSYEAPGLVDVPYSAYIPGGILAGSEFIITGRTDPKCNGFSVNLCNGPKLDGNCILHFNPRFESKVVVRNHKINGQWKSEERHGGMPFAQDSNFEIRIEVTPQTYEIHVNHIHFCTFRHYLPKESVQYLFIDGAILIHSLDMRRGQNFSPAQPKQPKLPPYSPYPHGVLTYPSGSGPIISPPIPFTTSIPGELVPGKIIFLTGVPYSSPGRFTINLACGPHESYNIALHFDVRFTFGSDRNQVVRTHKQGGSYATEERHQEYFPFFPAANFELMILVEKNSFKIAVNNRHFTEFIHRVLPLERVTHLMVLGDVQLLQVRFQKYFLCHLTSTVGLNKLT
ncbi:Galectin-4 [Bulinus truncatus]|nr:Galectin-4 [Bulinus truncatus]